MADNAEFVSGTQVKTAFVKIHGAGVRPVLYVEIDGRARAEGCLDLGPTQEVEATSRQIRENAAATVAGFQTFGVGIKELRFRWPDKTVPYTIAPNLPNQNRVTDAIAHWHEKTKIKFVQRTDQDDFVTFRPGSGCSSSVGRQEGQQFVTLGPDCTTGNCIHEIGHTVGLWHEQSRRDRDLFVRVHLENVMPGMEHNFTQHLNDGIDLGTYDYASIMHYPKNAFSKDGSATIEPVFGQTEIGQRLGLSAGDIKAVEELYKAAAT
ncbi:hypothetical protein ACVIW2_005085 [Bradyrhizobium huanghuaihaiense]